MGVEYDLGKAHPVYRRAIPPLVERLAWLYPKAPLRRVRVYEPAQSDRSLANEDRPGVISLNLLWFGAEPETLQRRALQLPRYHGPMIEEPQHVLTHEFGHVLCEALEAGWQDRAAEAWASATAEPERAPTPYALSDPDEYFAELFALAELGFATREQRRRLGFITGV